MLVIYTVGETLIHFISEKGELVCTIEREGGGGEDGRGWNILGKTPWKYDRQPERERERETYF